MARTIHPPSPPKPISSLRVEFLPCEGLSGTSLPSTIVCLGVRRQSGEAMKCVRTGSAQNTAQPFGEKQRVEKMTYNCEAVAIGWRVLKELTKSLSPGRWFYSNLPPYNDFLPLHSARNGGAFTFKLSSCVLNWKILII